MPPRLLSIQIGFDQRNATLGDIRTEIDMVARRTTAHRRAMVGHPAAAAVEGIEPGRIARRISRDVGIDGHLVARLQVGISNGRPGILAWGNEMAFTVFEIPI